MAEKNLEPSQKASSLKTSPSSSGSANQNSSRLARHNRIQHENSDHVARLFDILERARHNLRDLEKRRFLQAEGLKSIRARLFKENQQLRLTVAAVPSGSTLPTPASATIVQPGGSRAIPGNRLSETVVSASCPRKKTSSKSVTIAQPPSQSQSLNQVSECPKASSSRSLQKKGSSRIIKKSKRSECKI